MRGSKLPTLRNMPTATGGITRLACARLREHGKDVTTILARVGLATEAVDDPAARLDARAQIEFLDLAGKALGDESFGFHLARGFDLRALGLVYYVMASSEKLFEALRNAERYSRLVNDGVRLQCNLAEGATVTLEYVGFDRQRDRHHTEFWLVTLVRICREVTDSRFAPRRLRVRHMRSQPLSEYESFFGTDVEFGSNIDEIALSPSVASLPVARRDSYLNSLLRRYAEEALASRTAERASMRSEVERVLSELLPHGTASPVEVARRLGTSSRTLSRRLREEGTTFAEIKDQLRAALARRYLEDRELPVSEVAWLLGYREVSSFTHAFRRWTAMTPREFRGVR